MRDTPDHSPAAPATATPAAMAERDRAHARRFRALAASQIVWVADPCGRIVEDLPEWRAFTGQSAADILGFGWRGALHPDDAPALAAWEAALAAGEPAIAEFRVRRADGEYRLLQARGQLARDEQGAVVEWVAALADVTEQQRLEHRAHATLRDIIQIAELLVTPAEANGSDDTPAWDANLASRLSELVRHALGCEQVSIASIDPDTEIMRPIALAGFTSEQASLWWAGWRPDTTIAARMGAAVARIVRAGESAEIDPQQPAHRERLRPFPVRRLLIVPARVGGQVIGLLALNYDPAHSMWAQQRALALTVAQLVGLVIERDRLLRLRAAAQAQALALHDANRRMDAFLGIASHELKTPVTVILANVQLLLRTARREATRDERRLALLASAEGQLKRLTRLLDDMVDISRIQTGKLDLRLVPTDVAEVVREAVRGQRLAHPDRRIQFAVNTDREPRAVADPDRLGQVVINFLTNALKYSDADQPIHVRVATDHTGMRVEVADHGPGIPADELDRIWEVFHRVPGVEVRSGSGVGLGLGLHICQTIIARHGGQVGVTSAVGAGSTFWFTLPWAEGVG